MAPRPRDVALAKRRCRNGSWAHTAVSDCKSFPDRGLRFELDDKTCIGIGFAFSRGMRRDSPSQESATSRKSVDSLSLPLIMHIASFAELAAVLANSGPSMLHQHRPVSPEAVNAYWSTSRSRLDLWHQAMARFTHAKATGDPVRMRVWWEQHLGVLEEILVSELMTRTVAAIADGLDRREGNDHFSPITQAIYLSHLEARNRVLSAILDRRGCPVPDAVRLNQIRRASERWIDALIGRLSGADGQLARFGLDISRVAEHARDARESAAIETTAATAWLTHAAMADGLSRRLTPRASLPHANRAVADSVLMILGPHLFDGLGMPKSLWMHRITSHVDRTDQKLDEERRRDEIPSAKASVLDMIQASAIAHWFR